MANSVSPAELASDAMQEAIAQSMYGMSKAQATAMLGVPAKILRSNEEVAEIRNQRAQAEAQAAQLAQAQQEANIAQAAAPMVKAINTK